jgi:hypothetical protein
MLPEHPSCEVFKPPGELLGIGPGPKGDLAELVNPVIVEAVLDLRSDPTNLRQIIDLPRRGPEDDAQFWSDDDIFPP